MTRTHSGSGIADRAVSPEALLESLHWRYAVKKFDPARKIPQPAWLALEESLVLAPSSFGLQPWKFFVVDDPALRAKLKPVSWNQSQVTDAARLVVFAGRKNFGPADIGRFVDRIAEVRGVSVASLDSYKQMMVGSLTRPAAAIDIWVSRQIYIALGFFLTAAAALGVDACPMEGIDPAAYDRILGLESESYSTLCVATAGYRAADDAYAKLPKVRFPQSQVIKHV